MKDLPHTGLAKKEHSVQADSGVMWHQGLLAPPRSVARLLHDICASTYSTGVWRFRGYPDIPAG